MFLQTVIETYLCFQILLKTATDGAADSARCMGLCAHSTCRSTMPARELSTNDSEETMAT